MLKLKENIVLIAGISLPLILMAFFAIASYVPTINTDPPEYDFIFSNDGGYSGSPNSYGYITFQQHQGNLRAHYVALENPNYSNPNRLYYYEAATGEIEEITYELPDEVSKLEPDDALDFDLKMLSNLKLDFAVTAPDGYAFRRGRYRSRGIMGDIFSTGSSYRDAELYRDNNIIRLPDSMQNANFHAWVIDGTLEESHEAETAEGESHE